MTFGLEAKSGLTFKGIIGWTKTKMNQHEQKFCATFGLILLAFPGSYLMESGFSHVHDLLSNQRSTLNIKCGDLWLHLSTIPERTVFSF